jgi:S-DNA-T family DNA segregation ATPase FtsK/SpoIIIE
MRLTLTHFGRRVDVAVEVADRSATVGDLLSAVVGRPAQGVGCWEGARPVDPDATLAEAGLLDGAVISTEPLPAGVGPNSRWELVVVGGLDAGRRFPLAVGRWVIGRQGSDADLDHPTVAAAHAALTITADGRAVVEDLGAGAGTWIDGDLVTGPATLAPRAIVRMGAVPVSVVPADDPTGPAPAPATGATTISFNRPPPPEPLPSPARVTLPRPRPPDPLRPAVGALGVLVPLVVGGVMAAALGDWRYGLLALLGPITALAQAVDGHRRRRRRHREDERRMAGEVARLRLELSAAATTERRRRHAAGVGPAEAVRRAERLSPRLWERRPGQRDVARVRLGTAALPWTPPTEPDRLVGEDVDERVAALLKAHRRLAEVPLEVDLDSEVVGLVGPRAAALAVARSLVVQAVVHQGPADLAVEVAADAGHLPDWDWVKWLPHRHPAPLVLTVLDERVGWERPSAIRTALARGGGGIVVAERHADLPARCHVVVELVGEHGEAALVRSPQAGAVTDLVPAGLGVARAEAAARGLARLRDPEAGPVGAGLPASVSLPSLLGQAADAAAIARRWEQWEQRGVTAALATPIGVGTDGVVGIDLVADGPHALVAGTTGSGKSELLRSLIVGLAVTAPPTAVTFLLVDFKGGAAFADCARLPHAVGLVTDLDPHLAERVLRSLGAEVRRRERRLRRAGVDDIASLSSGAPLPRLVVVVDEFATLAGAVPRFVESLVDLARRGRSLGLHLVLATQRPSGAVSEQIRSNTDLRIALRTQDRADAVDVVGSPDAATISRHSPGRALVRRGNEPPVMVQTAFAGGDDLSSTARLRLRPLVLSVQSHPPATRGAGDDLRRLVEACAAAHLASGRPAPRRPWLEPLPERLAWSALVEGADAGEVAIGLADDPDRQRQLPFGWEPSGGGLVLVGGAGSGTTTALLTVAHAVTWCRPPAQVHLYGLDLGTGGLRAIASLPHTGAVVTAGERERQLRLVGRLAADVEARRSEVDRAAARPSIVLLLDGLGTFRAAWDDGLDGVWSGLLRVFADGPAVGVHTVVTAARPGDVPAAMTSGAAQRLVFRLADPADAGAFGLSPATLPPLPPGRAVVAGTGRLVQVALPPPAPAGRAPAPWCGSRPAPIGTLPTVVDPRCLRADFDDERWWLGVGIGDRDLAPVGMVLHPGEHGLIAGPARSGAGGLLRTLAGLASAAPGRPTVLAVADSTWARAAPADLVVGPGDAARALAWLAGRGPVLGLVDEADRVEDADGALGALLDRAPPELRLVVAGHRDRLRARYGHWTRAIRASRTGLLLQPDVDLDGDLLGVRLPRRAPVPLGPGRGYLVGGDAVELVQIPLM